VHEIGHLAPGKRLPKCDVTVRSYGQEQLNGLAEMGIDNIELEGPRPTPIDRCPGGQDCSTMPPPESH